MKALIIGSGISGLTSAALLVRAGWDVTVFEQDDHIGGVTALAKQDGFAWEQGPLLLGDLFPGEAVYEALKSLGITIEAIREDRGIVMPDYDMWAPAEYQGPYWRKNRLKTLFPEETRGINRYYRLYDDMMYLSRIAPHPKNLGERIGVALRYLRIRPYASLDAGSLMKKLFKDIKIQALFLGILADFCVSPSEFIGLGVPFLNIETAFDKRIPLVENGVKVRNGFGYVRGSVHRLISELERVILDHGGKIRTSALVEKVLVEDGKAVGLKLADGENLSADLVIGSGGAKELLYGCVGKEHLTPEYDRIVSTFRPMESVFMVHLGVDFDPLKYQQSALCYYYGSYDMEEAIRKLRAGIYHEGEDGFLVYVPTKANPELAPEGHHCVTLYTVAPDTLAEGNWEELKEHYADRLVNWAEKRIPGLSSHIKTRLIKTPLDYRRMTHLEHSAFGGIVPDRNRQSPPHLTPVKGLYFVGAQSDKGGGITNCLMGAVETVRLIEQAFPKH